jgi:hypothetical protein
MQGPCAAITTAKTTWAAHLAPILPGAQHLAPAACNPKRHNIELSSVKHAFARCEGFVGELLCDEDKKLRLRHAGGAKVWNCIQRPFRKLQHNLSAKAWRHPLEEFIVGPTLGDLSRRMKVVAHANTQLHWYTRFPQEEIELIHWRDIEPVVRNKNGMCHRSRV